MSKLIAFTVELYKADKRIKKDERYGRNKKGLRFVETVDFTPSTRDYISTVEADMRQRGFVVNVVETFVEMTNLQSGKKYQERYDTPSFCSPSSESFWSM
jgi:hypothetical protein